MVWHNLGFVLVTCWSLSADGQLQRSAGTRPPNARRLELRRRACQQRLADTDFSLLRFSTGWASTENMTAFVDCLYFLRTVGRPPDKGVHAGGIHYPTMVVTNHRHPVVSSSSASWCWLDKQGRASGVNPKQCCDTSYGPTGFELCWDNHFTYELCCLGNLREGELPHYYSVPAMDLNVANIVKKQGTFDIRMSYALQALVRPGYTVIDVGANLGGFTVPLAERAGPHGKVHAFEPFRKVFQHMTANVALNGLSNVYTYNMAIGREEKMLELHVPDLNHFGAPSAMRVEGQFSPDQALMYDKILYEQQREKVQMRTLDSFDFDGKVDFIKIDVEFMELEVVMGAKRTISEHRPVIWAENEPYFKDQDQTFVNTMFAEYGYSCQVVADLELLCTPPEKAEEAVGIMERIMPHLNAPVALISLQDVLTAAGTDFTPR